MRIAIIGAGIFGLTTAVTLREQGHDVTVFEREQAPMMAASLVNQYRLHRGYHYPRSADTIRECLRTEMSFRRVYGAAIVDDDTDYYYCIAREGSKVDAATYRSLMDAYGLAYEEVRCSLVDSNAVEACFRVRESAIDPLKLRGVVAGLARAAGVRVVCGVSVAADELLTQYDFVVVAAYAGLNAALGGAGAQQEYQFEIVEKPLVRMPRQYKREHVVVMDGPFSCLDPFGQTGYFLLGNVVHAIHATNTGTEAFVPESLRPLMNKGFIRNPSVTHIDKFIASGRSFIPALVDAQHIGSMYAVRAVLPRRDATDERPTIVTRVSERVCTVFAGKLSNCVQAADDIADIISSLESAPRQSTVNQQW